MKQRADAAIGLGAWRREPSTQVRRGGTGPSTVSAPFAVIAESEVPSTPLEWQPHTHPLHELVWAHGGTMTVWLEGRVVTVPSGLGLWIPAEVLHGGRVTAGARFHNAFFDAQRSPVAFSAPTTIEMTAVLESLLGYLGRDALAPGPRMNAEAVVFDVIHPAALQLSLTLPGDPRIDAIVAALLLDPADGRGVSEWAALVGASERTIGRAFRASTGLSFQQWRQALRMHTALTLLSEGYEVQEASELLGYAQPSTFIASFKRVMGTTPGAFAPGTLEE